MKVARDVNPVLLAAIRREGLDTVEGAFAYGGGEDLVKPGLQNRRRTRLLLKDAEGETHELYLKRYQGETLRRRLQRWWAYGPGTSPAGIEFDNIEAVRLAGIPTMRAILCGQDHGQADARRSYLIVTAVPGEKLEACISDFLDRHAGQPEAIERFTVALAGLVRTLHEAGYVHRDLYSSHVFLDESAGPTAIHLIDLARVFRPRVRTLRWWVKDLAQLKSSMPPARWTERYWTLFLREYLGPRRHRAVRPMDRRIARKVAWMRYRTRRKGRQRA